ncbi:MAG: putative response-associated peptidase YedK [Verrucomicrobiota bacterium]|jgi:putative SOS response-associated peptidase YedK
MCGRYRIKETDELTRHLRDTFNVPDWVPDRPRYNIAPSQNLPVLVMNNEGRPEVTTMRWGFVPYWEKSEKPKLAPINAQAEKAAVNGMFRAAVQKRRCLVPADGFYEWLRLDEKTKIPFDIHLRGGRSFFMAGIYECATENRPATYALLTTGPNELMLTIHNRMPAILDDEEAKQWIAPGAMTPEQVATLTAPHPAAEMEAFPISGLVNSPRNNAPEILEPVAFTRPSPPAPKPVQTELF